MLAKVAWAIAADGTLFKGAFVVVCDDEEHAIERAKAALGREASAANFYVKATADWALDLGRSEYPADGKATPTAPVQSAGALHFHSMPMMAFDLGARANVVATDEAGAFKKLGHALIGKDVGAVKLLRTHVADVEELNNLSSFERHLLEKQFRGIRVAST